MKGLNKFFPSLPADIDIVWLHYADNSDTGNKTKDDFHHGEVKDFSVYHTNYLLNHQNDSMEHFLKTLPLPAAKPAANSFVYNPNLE